MLAFLEVVELGNFRLRSIRRKMRYTVQIGSKPLLSERTGKSTSCSPRLSTATIHMRRSLNYCWFSDKKSLIVKRNRICRKPAADKPRSERLHRHHHCTNITGNNTSMLYQPTTRRLMIKSDRIIIALVECAFCDGSTTWSLSFPDREGLAISISHEKESDHMTAS